MRHLKNGIGCAQISMMIGSKTAPIRDLILVQDRKYPSSRLTYTARPDYTYQNKTKNMGCCSRSGRGWRRFPARQVLDCMQAWILSSGSRALAVCQCWFDRRGVDADPVAGAAVVCRGRLASQSSTARRSYRIHLPSPDHGGPSPRARIADRCSGVTPISRAHSLLVINGLRARRLQVEPSWPQPRVRSNFQAATLVGLNLTARRPAHSTWCRLFR
jgi:hypothetical protein